MVIDDLHLVDGSILGKYILQILLRCVHAQTKNTNHFSGGGVILCGKGEEGRERGAGEERGRRGRKEGEEGGRGRRGRKEEGKRGTEEGRKEREGGERKSGITITL